MKDIQIEKFGTKLMISTKSINNTPYKYLSYAQNVRIFGIGIGPARGKQSLISSSIGTNNKGAFSMNGKLYQITNSKIYLIDPILKTQTEITSLGYDAITDILVYSFPRGDFTISATESHNYNVTSLTYRMYYDAQGKQLTMTGEYGDLIVNIPLTFDNSGKALPSVRIIKATTDGYIGVGNGFDDGLGVILLDGEYALVRVAIADNPSTVNVEVGYYNTLERAIIASKDRDLSVFNGETISTVSIANTGIIEYCRGYSFLANNNILLISRPITVTNPEYAYDFIGTGSQQILYKSNITGLKETLNGLYVFTKDTIEFLGANSLQNVAGSATLISTPLGKGGEAISSNSIVASGDTIFYVTKNKEINIVNYAYGTSTSSIQDLSSQPVVGFDEYLSKIDTEQTNAFGFENKNDGTIQFHLKEKLIGYNNICIVYDTINETWCIDKGKNYNYVVNIEDKYYGFSDINSSIYLDDTGNTMAGVYIPSQILTQDMNQGSLYQKLYGGFFTAGSIGPFTSLNYQVLIDKWSVFIDTINGDPTNIGNVGELGGDVVGEEPVGGELTSEILQYPFDRVADEGRIFTHGTRIQIMISSTSLIQDYLIDVLGVRADATMHIDTSDKF